MPTIGQRIIETLGGVTQSELSDVRRRAYEAGYTDRSGEDEPISGTTAKLGYRSLNTKALRDFYQVDHASILEIVWTLWQSSPIARRFMTIKRDHIVGRGIMVDTESEDLKTLIADFWKRNKLDLHLPEFVLQLFLLGEQCYPVFVRKADGRTLLGYFDPSQIEEVIMHPENSMEPWAVIIARDRGIEKTKTWEKEKETRVYRIVRRAEEFTAGGRVQKPKHEGLMVTAEQADIQPWEKDMLKAYKLKEYTGSCFFTRVNAASNQPRGYSDLLQAADWIDQAEATLFALADREQMAGYFSWDVTLIEADESQVLDRASDIQKKPPKKGSVNVHNDSEEWSFVFPDIKQQGSVATFKALIGMILGGGGYPIHWFAFADDANRATALAQGDPTAKSLQHDQSIVRHTWKEIVQFVIDQAIISGQSKFKDDIYDLTMTEITTKDLSRSAQLFAPLAAALINAIDTGLMTREAAVQVWVKMLTELGVELDSTEELKKAKVKEEKPPQEGPPEQGPDVNTPYPKEIAESLVTRLRSNGE